MDEAVSLHEQRDYVQPPAWQPSGESATCWGGEEGAEYGKRAAASSTPPTMPSYAGGDACAHVHAVTVPLPQMLNIRAANSINTLI